MSFISVPVERSAESFSLGVIHWIIDSIVEADEIWNQPQASVTSLQTHRNSPVFDPPEHEYTDSVRLVDHRDENLVVNIEQRSCYQQANNHSCGYYALHNIITCLEWYHCKELASVPSSLHRMVRNGALFLKRYHHIQSQIRSIAENKDKRFYPWRDADVSSGLLEREYARMLLNSSTDETLVRWKHNITVISSFGLNEMMNGAMFHTQVHALSDVFQKFEQRPSRGQVFLDPK